MGPAWGPGPRCEFHSRKGLAPTPRRRDTRLAMSQENVEVVRRLIEHWEQGDWRWGSDTFEVRLNRIIDAGDQVVALTHIRARGQASGAAVDALTGGIFTLRGGKIVRYVLTDAREALKAAGLRE